ncbi:unnamed protein product, partial [Laminaria digitata]
LPFHTSWRSSFFMLAMFLTACSADSCDCEGFIAQPYPPEHYDKTMPQGAQVRLSPTGIDFVEENLGPIVDGALPGGLNICLPKDDMGDPKLCFPYVRGRSGYHMQGEQPFCDDGTQGCQINLTIENTVLTPAPPNKLEVRITIGNLNPTIPFETDVDVIGEIKCDVTPFKAGADLNTPATITAIVPVTFNIDQQSPTKDLRIDVGEIELDLRDLDFQLDGGFKCATANFLRDTLRSFIEDIVRDQLADTVDGVLAEQLCLSCADDPMACPDSASCNSDDICEYNNTQECVPNPLGIEGRLLLGETIGDFTQEPDASVDTLFKMADYVNVDTGLTLTGRSGFQSPSITQCAPIDPTTRPSFEAIPISPTITGDVNPDNGQPFMVGIGVHKRLVEQMLWSTWASGATCLVAGTSASDQLATSTLSVLLRSIRTIADDKNSEVEIRIVPQRKPEVILGANTVVEDGDTYKVEEGLLTIDWKDLDIHMYGYVQDRWTRLFTVRIDLFLPIAIVPDGMGKLSVALGDFEAAIMNVRPRNANILSDNPERLVTLIPTLFGLAVPSLASALDLSFDLPEFFGLRIAIGQGDILAVDNDTMIAIFANLEAGTMPLSGEMLPEPIISDFDVRYPEPQREGALMRPVVELDVRGILPTPIPRELEAGEEVEFSYRVDGGPWSMFWRTNTLRIDSPSLILPGEHDIEVRARMTGYDFTVNREQLAAVNVAIDYQPPTLELEREGDHIDFIASDLTDLPKHLTYRWRVHDGQRASSWTAWSHTDRVTLEEIDADGAFRLEVEVRDRSGKITTEEKTVHQGLAPGHSDATPTSGDEVAGEPQAGCSAATKSSPGDLPAGLLLLLGMFGLSGARRRKLAGMLTALIGLSVLGSGCKGCTDDPPSGQTSLCDPECAEGEVCKANVCVAEPTENNGGRCAVDSECSDGQLCENQVCVEPECRMDVDCAEACGDSQRGVCDGSSCECVDYCPEGCGDEEFCCFAKDSCQEYPDPCDGKVCDPGFGPGNGMVGTADSQTCMVSGSTCECLPLPPLPLGYHGRYPSLARAADGTTYVASYNQTYGDLLVGSLDGSLEVTWQFVDGVPETGDIEGNLSGPRGGIGDDGPDVGEHTALAVDDQGVLHVFYRDVDNGALKYGRGQGKGGDDFGFSLVTLDEEGDTGYWTQALFAGGKIHVAYQTKNLELDGGGGASQVRYLEIDPTQSAEAVAAAATPTVLLDGPGATPCTESCADGQFCMRNHSVCAAPTADCGDVDCGDDQCYNGVCEPTFTDGAPAGAPFTVGSFLELSATPDGLLLVFHDGSQSSVGWLTRGPDATWSMPQFVGSPSGPYASGTVDANGILHMAYMDEPGYALVYEQLGESTREIIAFGLRDANDEWLLTRIGESVTLRLGADGQPDVLFQDATLHSLVRSTRLGANQWATQTLAERGDPYTGAHGFYMTMIRASGDSVAVEYVIDSQAEEPHAFPVFHQLP